VIWVSEFTVIAALTPPKSTAVAPVKPLPLIVTVSPPAPAPLAGEIAVTCGGAVGAADGGELELALAETLTGPAIPPPDGPLVGARLAGPVMPRLGDGAGWATGPDVCGGGVAVTPGGPFMPVVPPPDPPGCDTHAGARVSPPTPWVGQPDSLPPAALMFTPVLRPHPVLVTTRITAPATARIKDIGRRACHARASSTPRRVHPISVPPPDPNGAFTSLFSARIFSEAGRPH
jgi:hypothetical protein